MSKALIVYGYYDEADHYGALLETVKKELTQAGIDQIDVVNTFAFTQKHLSHNKEDFSAATADWFRGLRTPENDALIKGEQERILDSTHIIFLYPIWWESLPYYMMSWVSEVFRSVSFRVGAGGQINPQWMGDRKVMIMTTAGFDQAVRREYFEKLLPDSNSDLLRGKSAEEAEKFMHIAQTYPLMTALNYSGLKFSKQCHICGVQKGDEPRVLTEAQAAIRDFLKPAPEPKEVVKDVLDVPKTLLLSGGPAAQPEVPSPIQIAAPNDPQTKVRAMV